MKEPKLFWTITTDSNDRIIATTHGLKNQDGGSLSIFINDARIEELRQGGDFVHDIRGVA